MTESLTLGCDLRFADLHGRDGLVRLDGHFVNFLKAQNADLHNRLMAARAAPEQVAGKPESDLIVELAPVLEEFIAELFGIAHEVRTLRARHDALAPLYSVKRLFVQRRAAKKFGPDQAAAFDGPALRRELEPLLGGELTELRFAERVDAWMKAEADNAALASEASGQRGDFRVRAPDTRPEPGCRRTRRRSTSPPAMPLGPRIRRRARSCTRPASCSSCRTRSTRTISFRSRPKWWTA